MEAKIVALDARCIGKPMTGDATYWTGLVQGLRELASPDLRYLLYSDDPKPADLVLAPNMEWVHLESRRSRWWSLFRFPLAARRAGASSIHVQYNLSPLITRGGITTIHDCSFYHEPEWFRPQDRLFLQRFVPPSARRAERVITVSKFSKKEIHRFISGLADSRVVVMPNAVSDDVRLIERDEARQIVEQRLGINVPYVFTLGTRWPRKNLSLAIQAMDALSDRFGHPLVVTGKPGWGEEATGRRTIYTDYVDNDLRNALYSAADLYLAPALYEGFGITLLEAMRCGCPVLASLNGAHEEVADQAAEFAADFQVATWTQSIARLLGPDFGKLGELRARGFPREKQFRWDQTARLTEAIYRETGN
jgi:glycosyltransferase involved in cell wall biosynthesis